MLKDYRSITEAVGPLMLVEGVEGKIRRVSWSSNAKWRKRRGRVLEINEDKATIQLLKDLVELILKILQ